MKLKVLLSLLLCYGVLFSSLAYSQTEPAVLFFFSNNNTEELSLEAAYGRLIGQEQNRLQKSAIKILQKNHIEQDSFKSMLGAYCLSSAQQLTAENTDLFTTSPYQRLSKEKVFKLARRLAQSLKQESMTVFIFDKNEEIGKLSVSFIAQQPTISELVNTVKTKLPTDYSQDYSLYFSKTPSQFTEAKVDHIEWLGSELDLDEVKKAFPHDKVSYFYGKTYVVYKDGQVEEL